MQPTRRHCANAIRALAMDAVQQARSGHPGMPMGMADLAEVLWRDFLKFNPNHPEWCDRDRFVISNGHGAMLQYALLHLTGYDLSIDDLKQFRQLHSKTPGHPELGDTPGVETTTGPLGQGLANAVGMAIAERRLAAEFNREGHTIVDHRTVALVGDGCLMEGLSHEVCSLAGTLGLGKLTVIYDDNGISIDGDVDGWFTENVEQRFLAYHWHVVATVDGHDPTAVAEAIEQAQQETDRPSLICCQTQIGFGAPRLAGTAQSHGAPLGEEEIQLTREQLDWPYPPFEIPEDVKQAWNQQVSGQELEDQWNQRFSRYETEYPELAAEFLRRQHRALPASWSADVAALINQRQQEGASMATRKASQGCLESLGPLLPELLGGSADLTGSNCTAWSGSTVMSHERFQGNYINYGVREFGMFAIMNGLALHGEFIPYGGTFLVFSDYARNAIRLSALMKQRVVMVLTHDSIGLGEDGPTHQPIEHAASLRMIPHLHVWRPADTVETMAAWTSGCAYQGPTALLLSRQTLPHQERSDAALHQVHRGAYVLWEPNTECDGIIMATGSEVALAIEAAKALQQEQLSIRVVSMPCCEVFRAQDRGYRESVLPSAVKTRVAVEAGVTDYWYQWVGLEGQVVGIDQFGRSAPMADVFDALGVTVAQIKAAVHAVIKEQQPLLTQE